MGSPTLAKRQGAIKKALVYHLAGLGGEHGLAFKALERLNAMLDSGEPKLVMEAIDKVIKLLPYAVEREGIPGAMLPGPNGSQVLNIQINNFDSFIKERLSHTNLGKLLNVEEIEPIAEVANELIAKEAQE